MKTINNSLKMIIWDILILICTVILDQIAKSAARVNLAKGPIPIIDGILEFYYLENKGASFGILEGKKMLFVVIAIIATVFILFLITRIPQGRRYIPLNISLILIVSGAIGNTIDRVAKGSVTDFVYFMPINFPVFNVADMYITISTVWLLFLVLFFYKDDELSIIFGRDKKTDSK